MLTALVTLSLDMRETCFAENFIYDSVTYCFVDGSCSGWQQVINIAMNL